MGHTVRRATAADGEAVAKVHVASWRAAYRGLLPDAYLDGLDWRDHVDRPLADALVVQDGDTIVGWARFGPPRDRDLRPAVVAELYAIYLDPAAWGRGVGSELLAGVVTELPTAARTLVLWVAEGNERAIAFYERRGFRADGARRAVTRDGRPLAEVRYRITLPRRA